MAYAKRTSLAKRREAMREGATLAVGAPLRVDEWDESAVRRHDCVHYSGCLDYAMRKDWPGFDCRPCPSYARGNEAEDAAGEIVRSVVGQRRDL